MMQTLPTGSQGRALALGLLLLTLIALVAAYAVPAYLLDRHYDRARTGAEDRIDRYRRIAANKDTYQQALDALNARESGRFLLRNTAPNLGGAEFTDLVRPLLEGNGARVTSIQPPTVKDDGGYRLYTLNVSFSATPENLKKALHALETHMPYLFLENLTLRSSVPRGFRPVPNREPEVVAQVELQAYGPKDATRSNTPAGPAALTGARR